MTIQIKNTEQHFPVVLFIMLYKVVLSFESMDEILKWDHSHQTYCVERPCHGYRTVHMNVHTVEPRKIELSTISL